MQFPGDNLIVFAHPDDETVYFGGLLLSGIAGRADLVCVTDGNYRGRGAERREELARACEALEVRSVECLGYTDSPVLHLPVEEIGAELRRRVQERGYRAVFTHSAHGEYGSFNHMDVSLAAHQHLCDLAPVYSVADMLFPDFEIELTRQIHEKKLEILSTVYFDELRPVWRQMRLLQYEGYVRLDPEEGRAIHRLCTAGERPSEGAVSRYRPFLRWLDQPWKGSG
jgi:LmbE family N-acetylglucosaminyl deacetylase